MEFCESTDTESEPTKPTRRSTRILRNKLTKKERESAVRDDCPENAKEFQVFQPTVTIVRLEQQNIEMRNHCVNCYTNLTIPSDTDCSDITTIRSYPLSTEIPSNSSSRSTTVFQLVDQLFKLHVSSQTPPKTKVIRNVRNILSINKSLYFLCTNCYDKILLINELLRKLYSDTQSPSLLSQVIPPLRSQDQQKGQEIHDHDKYQSNNAEIKIKPISELQDSYNSSSGAGGDPSNLSCKSEALIAYSDHEYEMPDQEVCGDLEDVDVDHEEEVMNMNVSDYDDDEEDSDYDIKHADDEEDSDYDIKHTDDEEDLDEVIEYSDDEEDSDYDIKHTVSRSAKKPKIDLSTSCKEQGPNISCNYCCATFTKRDQYKRHAYSAHSSREIPCKACGGGFSSRRTLLAHIRLYHLELFENSLPQNSTQCENCCAKFRTKYHYYRHTKRSHSSKNIESACCKGTFSSTLALKTHNRIYHSTQDFEEHNITENENTVSDEVLDQSNGDELEVEPPSRNLQSKRSYECKNCCSTFLKQSHYKRHAISSHSSNEFISEECEGTFSTEESLQVHLKWYHSEKAVKKCKSIERERKRSATKVTQDMKPESNTDTEIEPFILSNDSERRYNCPNCCCTFIKSSHYKRHAISSHTSKEIKFEECNGTFNSTSSLDNHIKWYHSGKRPILDNKNDEAGSGDGEPVKYKSSKLDLSIEVDPPLKHKKSSKQTKKNIYCTNCCAKFLTYYHYKRHAVSAHTSKKFSCDPCKGTFSSDLTLQVHQRLYHSTLAGRSNLANDDDVGDSGEEHSAELYFPPAKAAMQFHPCSQCGTTFPDKRQLKLHLVNEHGLIIETKLQCPVCPRRCATKEVLAKHMDKYHLVRVLEKAHGCDICGHRFVKKHDLTNHMTTHTNERKYICEFCAFAGKRVQDLSRHIQQVHLKPANYSCETCGKKFVKNYQLINHQVCHTDSKDFPCPECGKLFRSSNNLRQHRYTHQQIKYPCNYCGNSYTRPAYLKKHIKTSHA